MTEPESISWRHRVRREDEAAIAQLLAETGFFAADEIAVAGELLQEALARGSAASGYHFLFAESIDGLAGYACYGPIACTRARWDLHWIAVAPARQGRGLGKALLAAVEATIRAQGGERLYIETSGREQYAPTRAFYIRAGYLVAATLPDFYDDADDKVVFVRALGGRQR